MSAESVVFPNEQLTHRQFAPMRPAANPKVHCGQLGRLELAWFRWPQLLAAILFIGCLGSIHLVAQGCQDSGDERGEWNLALPTMGGKQFWTDVACCGPWRIQRNAVDGHHRLLDDRDIRRAWGTLAECQKALQAQRDAGKVSAFRGRLVILLHGLIRTHDSMNRMAAHLEHHSSQPLNTICFQYASSQAEVGQHAQDLAAFIASIPADVTEIHLVAHSLGNIVIRHYLHDTTDPQSGRQGDPRIRRLVMLGPPNQGSRMARLLKNSLLFRTVTGDSGQQLATGWNELSKKLATPQTEFAIISGGDESPSLVEQKIFGGPTDYTVSVAETQLPGAADSLVLPVVHGFMMYDEAVRDATLSFIEHGYLVSPEAKSPIQ